MTPPLTSRSPEPNDPLGRSKEIKDCIARADLDLAVKRLIDYTTDFCPNLEDEVLILSMDFHTQRRELRMDMEDREVLLRYQRKVAKRILETLKEANRQIRIN